jgi:hypothetical protein
MSFDLPTAEVRAMAGQLRAATGPAESAAARLAASADIGGPLQPAVDALRDAHRLGAAAVTGELAWLAATVDSVVDAWLRLDASLLAPRHRRTPVR